jgi:hypothetical protein
MKNTDEMKRANRVAISKTEDGWHADFFKTHDIVGSADSKNTDWKAEGLSQTADRESFRAWVVKNADIYGVNWQPELQPQAWNRKYDKYSTDAQVEEDASELMWWTVASLAEKCKYRATLKKISLDSIIPMHTTTKGNPIAYCTEGKYDKNGNWAWADLQMEVHMEINGADIDIVYPMQIISGQIKKITLSKSDIDQMIKDAGYQPVDETKDTVAEESNDVEITA